MLRPVFHIVENLIKFSAGQYVQSIKLESIPLWKGEVVLDDLEINPDGLNLILQNLKYPFRTSKLEFSHLKVHAPVFSPGKQPVNINLNSLYLEVTISKWPNIIAANDQADQNSFVGKLLSNILVNIDGLAVKIIYQDIILEVVISGFEGHLQGPSGVYKGSNCKIFLSNSISSISFGITSLLVEFPNNSDTNLELTGFSISDDILSPCNLHAIFNDASILVHSQSQILITINFDKLQKIIELLLSCPFPPLPDFIPLVPMDLKLKSLGLKVILSPALSLTLTGKNVDFHGTDFDISPVSLVLDRGGAEHFLIEDLQLMGNLSQVEQRVKLLLEADLFKIQIRHPLLLLLLIHLSRRP